MGRYYRITTSSEETIELGKNIGYLLSSGDFVFCLGELGAGKTELIRGIVQGFCGNEALDCVSSPSFNYVNVYQVGEKVVHHFDLYRIESFQQLSRLGLEEMLSLDSVCCIEWPQLLYDVVKQNVLRIELFFSQDFLRKIVVDTHSFRKNIDLSHMLEREK